MTSARPGGRSLGVLLLFAVGLVFPWLSFVPFSVLGSANLAAYYALVAVSLVVLVGWVGQISLGHAGLVGVGAYVTGHVVTGWHLTFPVNLLWAGLAGGAVAALLGVVAVRVRGLYLAVATLIFSWTCIEFVFRQEWMTRHSSIEVRALGQQGLFPYFDWTSRRTYYYAAWATVATAVYLMANLRDSKTGRAFFAVRGSEVAAASLGISVTRTKLIAFAISGALAGVAGNLLIIRDQVVSPDSFKVEVSLFFLAIAVVGGLSSLGGAIAAAILFASLNELFFRLEFLSGWLEVVPPLLLTTALLLYRGGLAAIPGAVWLRLSPLVAEPLERARGVATRLGERLPRSVRFGQVAAELEPDALRADAGRLDLAGLLAGQASAGTMVSDSPDGETPTEVGVRAWHALRLEPRALPTNRDARDVLVEASGVTVRFGGLVAVNDVSLTVREGEIVGLIGPNGAGKTTTFNSIAGLNVPTEGRVSVFGQDVTTWSVDERARLGIGRTFQAVQLLPQLTVFENLMVATHLRNPTRLVSHLLASSSSLTLEADLRRQVRLVAAFLELDEHLDRTVADLPFGVLRMVELARALVTGSRLIMLDEPASGLDTTETDRLAALLRVVRDLGVTLLLIEHDVKMVTSVSDYMYVLDHGTLLAQGTPAEVQRDPRVIAAYLGQSAEPAVEAEAAVAEAVA